MAFKSVKILSFTLLLFLVSGYKGARQPEARLPQDALALFLPPDLEATLWAESPQFYNPTNLDVDLKGRVWVTEAVNYRDFNNKPDKVRHHPAGDRVMILADTDGDGKSDQAKVFVQDKDLVSPLGIAVIGNKVIVSCSPHVIVYTDENQDDVPDKKEILLTGFGGLDHDHGLHSILAGPDGRWYFNTGNAGPHVVKDRSGWTLRSGSMYTGGTPYAQTNTPGQVSDDGKVYVGGLALRMNPDGTKLEVLAHNFRNAYELAVDSYGNMWQNDNDDQVVACRTAWVMEGGNAGYFSPDGSRSWQADRRPGQDVFTAHWHQQDPGVMPANDNTGAGSPTGVTVNESDALGKKYRGMLLSADAGRNVIFGYWPQPQGAGFELKRHNFITSVKASTEGYIWNKTDEDKSKWFRPSDVTVGADGALYITDWYDPIVGGHQMHDTQGYGRIYRITPKGKNLVTPKIDLKTTRGQLTALLSPAVNVRSSGYEALRAQGARAFKPVRKLLKSENPYVRARAVWLLAALGTKGQAEVAGLLKNPDPEMRITALRALRSTNTNILPAATQLADDPSAAVRREVALTLRNIPLAQSKPVLLQLARQFDGTDRSYLEAWGTAADQQAEVLFSDLIKELNQSDPMQWSPAMAALTWRLHPVTALPYLHKRVNAPNLTDEERQQALATIAFTKHTSAADLMASLSKSNDPEIAKLADWWLNFRMSNDWANYTVAGWEGADQAKKSGSLAKMQTLQTTLLNAGKPQKERLDAALAMAQDETGGQMLISLAEQKKLNSELTNAISKVIFTNPDQTVRVLATDYFKPAGRQHYVIPQIAKLKPQVNAGQVLFQNKCATCHRVGKTGADIGPELTQIKQKFDKNSLLDAVINPSAAMAFGYESWLITTKDGTPTYGFLQTDGETVILKDTAGKRHQIKAQNIASRKQFSTSIMPDPSALKLTDQDLANIAEYLLTFRQN